MSRKYHIWDLAPTKRNKYFWFLSKSAGLSNFSGSFAKQALKCNEYFFLDRPKNLLVLFSFQLIVAVQAIYEESFIKKYNIPPLKVVGFEGDLR